MHVTTPRCFRIDDGVAFDLPKDLRLQLGDPCRMCATMDGAVCSYFQNWSRSLWKACPVGLWLICNASSASCVYEKENPIWQYKLETMVMLLRYTNIIAHIGEIYNVNRQQINWNELQVETCNGTAREEGYVFQSYQNSQVVPTWYVIKVFLVTFLIPLLRQHRTISQL